MAICFSAAAAAAAAAAVLAGCSRDPDTLELFFVDELVEAPARTAHLAAVEGVECEALLSLQHDEASTAGTVILQVSGHYPIDPKTDPLATLPRGKPIALEAAVYDADAMLMARGCEVVTLEPSSPTNVRIELHALPQCANKPQSVLDVTLVLDTSTAMAVADTEKTHITDLETRVVDAAHFPEGSTWSIVTHGHTTPPAEVQAPTSDLSVLKHTLDSLIPEETGAPLLYDAVYKATTLMRARAVCGRRPALLVILGGRDSGSRRVVEDAILELVGTRGDATDDIYTYGLGLTQETYDALNELIPEDIGVAAGAETEFLRRSRLSEAATALRALVP